MIRIVGTFAAALALVGVGGALAGSISGEALPGELLKASKGKIANPDYVGKGRFDRSMKVAFRIDENRGRELVRFEARDVSFACNDNTIYERRDLPALRAQLAGKEFERVAWGNFDTSEGSGERRGCRGP